MIEYSMEEFSRCRNFEIIFPKENNCEDYSKFIDEPEEENIIFWIWFKHYFPNTEYKKLFSEI